MLKFFGITTIFFYLLACFYLVKDLFASEEKKSKKRTWPALACTIIALGLHGGILYKFIFTTTGLNLGFYNAFSLICWSVSLIILLLAVIRPLENLGLAIFPLSSISILLIMFFPGIHSHPVSIPFGMQVHIVLSIFAYSLLTIATLQAVFLAIQDRQISKKHPASIMQFPPMQVMEELLIQIVWTGFFMLSLSLVTGLLFVENILAQHLVHKTFFSILAWLIFGILLLGRHFHGWRGKRIVRWTIGGFVLLMLAYFGTKLVLELILQRT